MAAALVGEEETTMSERRRYTLTIQPTDAPPAEFMGGPAGQTFGSAFTVTIHGDTHNFLNRTADDEFDLAIETNGQLFGKALFPGKTLKSGDLQLKGTEEPVRDRNGRKFAVGTILVDETGHLSEVERCIWRA